MKFIVDANFHPTNFLSQQNTLIQYHRKDFDSIHAHKCKTYLGNYRSLLGKTSPLEKLVKQLKHSLLSRTKYFNVNSPYATNFS